MRRLFSSEIDPTQGGDYESIHNGENGTNDRLEKDHDLLMRIDERTTRMVIDMQYIMTSQKEQAAKCPAPRCEVHERRIHDLESLYEVQEASRKAAEETKERDWGSIIAWVGIIISVFVLAVMIIELVI